MSSKRKSKTEDKFSLHSLIDDSITAHVALQDDDSYKAQQDVLLAARDLLDKSDKCKSQCWTLVKTGKGPFQLCTYSPQSQVAGGFSGGGVDGGMSTTGSSVRGPNVPSVFCAAHSTGLDMKSQSQTIAAMAIIEPLCKALIRERAEKVKASPQAVEVIPEHILEQLKQAEERAKKASEDVTFLLEEKERALVDNKNALTSLADENKNAIVAVIAEKEEAISLLKAEKEEAISLLKAEKEEAISSLTAEKEEALSSLATLKESSKDDAQTLLTLKESVAKLSAQLEEVISSEKKAQMGLTEALKKKALLEAQVEDLQDILKTQHSSKHEVVDSLLASTKADLISEAQAQVEEQLASAKKANEDRIEEIRAASKKEIDELDGKTKQQQETILQLTAEISALKADLATTRDTLSSEKNGTSSAAESISEISEKLSASLERTSFLSKSLDESESRKATAIAQKEELEKELKEMESKLAAALSASVTKQTSEMKVSSVSTSSQSAIEMVTSSSQSSQPDIAHSSAQTSDAASSSSLGHERHDSTSSLSINLPHDDDVIASREDSEMLSASREALLDAIARQTEAEAERGHFREQLDELKAEKALLLARIDAQSIAAQGYQPKLTAMATQIEEMTVAAEKAALALKLSEQRNKEDADEYYKKLESLNVKIMNLETDKDKYQREADTTKEELESARNRIHALDEALIASKEKTDLLNTTMATMLKELSELRSLADRFFTHETEVKSDAASAVSNLLSQARAEHAATIEKMEQQILAERSEQRAVVIRLQAELAAARKEAEDFLKEERSIERALSEKKEEAEKSSIVLEKEALAMKNLKAHAENQAAMLAAAETAKDNLMKQLLEAREAHVKAEKAVRVIEAEAQARIAAANVRASAALAEMDALKTQIAEARASEQSARTEATELRLATHPLLNPASSPATQNASIAMTSSPRTANNNINKSTVSPLSTGTTIASEIVRLSTSTTTTTTTSSPPGQKTSESPSSTSSSSSSSSSAASSYLSGPPALQSPPTLSSPSSSAARAAEAAASLLSESSTRTPASSSSLSSSSSSSSSSMSSVIADSLPQEDSIGWAQRIQATAATSLRQEELLKAQGEVDRLSDLRARMEGMSKRYSSGKTRLSTANALSSSNVGTNSPMSSAGSTTKPSLTLPSSGGGASSASVFAMSPEARMALGLSFSPVSSSFNAALRPPGSPSLATASAQAARKLDMAEVSVPPLNASATPSATQEKQQ